MTSPSDANQPAQPTGTVQQPGGAPQPGTVQPAGSVQQPGEAPQPGAAQQTAGPARHRALRRTRMGGVWVGLALSAVVLLLLLIFILENEQKVDIAYFGAHGHLPLGVALLLAAVAGALLALIPGTVRIVQLRRTARRHHAAAERALSSTSPPAGPAQPPPGGTS
jgi:lipopolysaccharide assembly protein A